MLLGLAPVGNLLYRKLLNLPAVLLPAFLYRLSFSYLFLITLKRKIHSKQELSLTRIGPFVNPESCGTARHFRIEAGIIGNGKKVSCLNVSAESIDCDAFQQGRRKGVALLRILSPYIRAFLNKVGVRNVRRGERSCSFLNRCFCIQIIRSPRIVECGMALCTTKGAVEVVPPFHVIP